MAPRSLVAPLLLNLLAPNNLTQKSATGKMFVLLTFRILGRSRTKVFQKVVHVPIQCIYVQILYIYICILDTVLNHLKC